MARLARLSCSPPPATGLTMADASSSAAPPGSSLRRSCQGPPCARSSGRPDGVNRRLRLAFALVALAAGLVNLALLLRLRTRHDLEAPFAETLLATLGVSWSFVAAGLVAWARRPGNRTGALMVAAGVCLLPQRPGPDPHGARIRPLVPGGQPAGGHPRPSARRLPGRPRDHPPAARLPRRQLRHYRAAGAGATVIGGRRRTRLRSVSTRPARHRRAPRTRAERGGAGGLQPDCGGGGRAAAGGCGGAVAAGAHLPSPQPRSSRPGRDRPGGAVPDPPGAHGGRAALAGTARRWV